MMRMTPLLVLPASVPALASLADAMPPCPPQATHRYWGPLGALAIESDTLGVHAKAGQVTVFDFDRVDCDGDGYPDFDGECEDGIGGAFFGHGPWAHEPVCAYMLHAHGPDVIVNDFVWGDKVRFEVGADDTKGPIIVTDPITGATSCETDGVISPCTTQYPCWSDPTRDPDDCLAGIYQGQGSTCGAGGDGGYWVILTS